MNIDSEFRPTVEMFVTGAERGYVEAVATRVLGRDRTEAETLTSKLLRIATVFLVSSTV